MPITTLNLETASSDSTSRRALTQLSLAVAKSRRIIVVTGAGISCSSGIPDFRSSDGLYNLVKTKYPDVVLKGRDLFDAALFRDATSTAVFYTFISGLKTAIDKAEPSATHHFIKALDKKGRLLRSYTQNIDGLEERVGLSGTNITPSKEADATKGKMKAKISRDVKNVQLHGDIHRVRCTICSASYPCEAEYVTIFQRGEAPECPECSSRCNERVARSARALRIGTLRPAIVLYDEPHPLGDDIATVQTADLSKKPDLLIVMGTSLKVHGLKKLVKEFAKAVHQRPVPTAVDSTQSSRARNESSLSSVVDGNVGKVIFVNKTPPSGEWGGVIDYHIAGTTDEWAERVLADWKKMRPTDWEVQTTLADANGRRRHSKLKKAFIVVKPVVTSTAKPRAGLSRRKMEAENIPPARGDKETLASSPKSKRPLGERNTETNVDVNVANGSLVKPQIFPACSSKRQSPSSHYDDDSDECSPRKKAKIISGFAAGKAVMKNKQSVFLFGSSGVIRKEATNSDEGARDFLEPPRLMAKAKPSSARAKILLEVPQRAMTALPIKTQFQHDDLCSDDGGPPRSQSTASLDERWSEGSSECEVDDLLANVSMRSALSSIKGDSARHPIYIDL